MIFNNVENKLEKSALSKLFKVLQSSNDFPMSLSLTGKYHLKSQVRTSVYSPIKRPVALEPTWESWDRFSRWFLKEKIGLNSSILKKERKIEILSVSVDYYEKPFSEDNKEKEKEKGKTKAKGKGKGKEKELHKKKIKKKGKEKETNGKINKIGPKKGKVANGVPIKKEKEKEIRNSPNLLPPVFRQKIKSGPLVLQKRSRKRRIPELLQTYDVVRFIIDASMQMPSVRMAKKKYWHVFDVFGAAKEL